MVIYYGEGIRDGSYCIRAGCAEMRGLFVIRQLWGIYKVLDQECTEFCTNFLKRLSPD